MQYLKTYLDELLDRGNPGLAESVRTTAEDVGSQYLSKFSWMTHEIGLLLGNVQSGKTGQMFGIMCKAADMGFPAFLLLTTDNVVLQQQTIERVRADLTGFCICDENDSGLFIENQLVKPAIVVLKKNTRILRLWANVFSTTNFMHGNALFIVDDEADAASLNTLVNRDRQSSINKHLETIRSGASSSMYLQVTGTPQAILLQTVASGWHPLFTYYFRPGKGYLGGDFFFPEGGTAECVSYTEDLDKPMRQVVVHHLAVSGQVFASAGRVCNCLIHPSVRQAQHEKFASDAKKELDWCAANLNGDFRSMLEDEYNLMSPKRSSKVPFDALFAEVSSLLKHGVRVYVMNGKTAVSSDYYSTGSNIIVGGNTLGRGVTFPGLHTIYYTRTAKNPQADTMWQHSRMFGYDRDPGMMRVFIDEKLYKLFSDINATNNAIIAQVERGIDDVQVFYPDGLRPTRKNVLDERHVSVISGGTNYYPYDPDNDDINALTGMLKPFTDASPSYQVNLHLIRNILKHIIPSEDFDLSAFNHVIDAILAKNPVAQGVLIVRRNRNVAQGTGALLSPNDWELGGKVHDKVVLTMYQVTGTKGWHGKQLWVPNIKLPHGIVYYDVDEG